MVLLPGCRCCGGGGICWKCYATRNPDGSTNQFDCFPEDPGSPWDYVQGCENTSDRTTQEECDLQCRLFDCFEKTGVSQNSCICQDPTSASYGKWYYADSLSCRLVNPVVTISSISGPWDGPGDAGHTPDQYIEPCTQWLSELAFKTGPIDYSNNWKMYSNLWTGSYISDPYICEPRLSPSGLLLPFNSPGHLAADINTTQFDGVPSTAELRFDCGFGAPDVPGSYTPPNVQFEGYATLWPGCCEYYRPDTTVGRAFTFSTNKIALLFPLITDDGLPPTYYSKCKPEGAFAGMVPLENLSVRFSQQTAAGNSYGKITFSVEADMEFSGTIVLSDSRVTSVTKKLCSQSGTSPGAGWSLKEEGFEGYKECDDNCRTITRTKEEPVATKTTGPGTELSKMLSAWGIKESAKCSCKKMSRLMDGWGAACATEPHLTTIIDHLQKEAKKRKLPFVRTLAKALVLRAVRRSENQS